MVFLHGWGLSSKIFEPIIYQLKNDFEVYSLDLPGFGSSPINKPMVLKNYADFVYEFFKKNKIERPIVIGHSFGGAVAVKLALLYPESVSKIILAGASAIRQPDTKIKILRKTSEFFSPLIPKKIRMIILKILKLEKSDYAAIQNPLLKETFKNIINENLAPFLNSVKVPTLIIWGENDTETPLKEGKLIAKSIPGARLEVIKNTGHFLFLEKPDKFIKLVKEFVL